MKRCAWSPNTQDYYSLMRQIIMAAIQYALAKNSKERRDTDYNIEAICVA